MIDTIISDFYKKMESINLNVYGVLDADNRIHTLGTDSKIIGRIFEMLTQPVLEELAEEYGLILHTPSSQTVYPDFVLMSDASSKEKIAIDIKTTYIESSNSTIKFTLGSFGSYMRNNTKNIEYCYTDYVKHYVIGFVYKRNDMAQESRTYNYDSRKEIACPYTDVEFFIQEKYKIAGDKPGSGNTENIGSISTRIFEDFKQGRGPFSELGQDTFDLYWKYYPKYRSGEKVYGSLTEFLNWFPQNGENLDLLHEYEFEDVVKRISEFKKNHNIT